MTVRLVRFRNLVRYVEKADAFGARTNSDGIYRSLAEGPEFPFGVRLYSLASPQWTIVWLAMSLWMMEAAGASLNDSFLPEVTTSVLSCHHVRTDPST